MSLPRPTAASAAIAAWGTAALACWLAINLGDGATASFTHLWPPTHPYWYNVLLAGGGITLSLWLGHRAAAAYGRRTYVGIASALCTAGIVSWSLGNLMWFWYNSCTRWRALACESSFEAPYPSLADIGYLMAPLLYAGALVAIGQMLAMRRDFWLPRLWVPALIVLVTSYLNMPTVELPLVGVDFGRSWLFGDDYGRTQQLVSVLYLLSDAVIMSMAVLLLMRSRHTAGGMLFSPLLLLCASLAALYAADMVFDQRAAAGTYYNGDIADGLYGVWLVLMLLALARLRSGHDSMRARIASHRGETAPGPHGSPA